MECMAEPVTLQCHPPMPMLRHCPLRHKRATTAINWQANLLVIYDLPRKWRRLSALGVLHLRIPTPISKRECPRCPEECTRGQVLEMLHLTPPLIPHPCPNVNARAARRAATPPRTKDKYNQRRYSLLLPPQSTSSRSGWRRQGWAAEGAARPRYGDLLW